jgi:hypothetical protein
MLSQADVVPLLLKACPGLQPIWAQHLAWWQGEERGIFNDTGEIAQYLVESMSRGDTSEFDGAFQIVEQLIRDGDNGARAAAVTGILESVQVISTHYSCGPDAFIPWLGSLSGQAWSQIEATWAASGGSLAGVIRNER